MRHCSDLRGLSFDISLNKSERPVGLGCDSVHMSFPTEFAGEIHLKVPGVAENPLYFFFPLYVHQHIERNNFSPFLYF